MLNTISVTDAARNFSDVINRIYYQRKSYLLTRGGAVVAKLTPADAPLTGARLATLWEARPRLDPDDAAAWEADLAALKAGLRPPEDAAWDS
jgi:antitoxin (DNA-binding transcriptional repressor) of toxin-antitoxin stability system